MCIAIIIINIHISQVHFDDKQFEQAREDGRKMLRPNAIPNLLIKRKADREKRDVTTM